MFGKRRQPPVIPFDRGGRVPVIRSSICTGEQTAGFKDPVSEKFMVKIKMLTKTARPVTDQVVGLAAY